MASSGTPMASGILPPYLLTSSRISTGIDDEPCITSGIPVFSLISLTKSMANLISVPALNL